jgi:cardiolipin synthase
VASSVGGNKADLLSDYEESIAAMAREIRTAEQYVHVEFYIMSWDSTTSDFFEALAEVAARGVRCGCCSIISAPPAFPAIET